MIRMDRYDAYDKWEILRGYWADREHVPDLGLDRLGRLWLPRWTHIASSHGSAACSDYIRLKLDFITASSANDIDGGDEMAVNRELVALSSRLSLGDVQALVRRLADDIPEHGFADAFNELPPRTAERLREVFKTHAVLGLRWTEDPDEIPSIEVLRSQAARFPVSAIKAKRSVLSLFCANFFGRSDVIHVYDAAPDQATLVDNDEPRMEAMKLIYPPNWSYACGDYKEFLRQSAEDGLSYDLVVADPPVVLIQEVAWDALAPIMALCGDTFIVNYLREMFEELGVSPDDLDAVSRAVSEKTGVDVRFTQVLPRGPQVSWAVMRKA